MATTLPRIFYPELFFGFVAPIGANLSVPLESFRRYFKNRGYTVVTLKVTDAFDLFKNLKSPIRPLVKSPAFERYSSYIAYGNQLRHDFADDAFLSVITIARLVKRRLKLQSGSTDPFTKTVYLMHQFKRKEEIDLLRSVYGVLFFQVSIYSRRGSRVDFLSRDFAHSENLSAAAHKRHQAEKIVQDDEDEIQSEHGQRVGKIFHDADFIINLDSIKSVESQVVRFCELVFGVNNISPTKSEYGMFLAKAAALRSLDLSRQVGATIVSSNGEIIALGCNEIPKSGGGTYWCEEIYDDRDYARGVDSNLQRKKEILRELFFIAGMQHILEDKSIMKQISESQFMDAIEYGRMLHAEMNAIVDAARMGHATRSATLYCTTFPCHLCAKNIIGAGIENVIFLEPYPKSLAFDLHTDSAQIEGGDRGRYQEFPAVKFEHFSGVTHRRYRELFERGIRKDKETGTFQQYDGEPHPNIDIKSPFYSKLEERVIEALTEAAKVALSAEVISDFEE